MRLHVHVEPLKTLLLNHTTYTIFSFDSFDSYDVKHVNSPCGLAVWWLNENWNHIIRTQIILTDVVGDASSFKDYCVNCFSRKDVLNTSDLIRF